MYGLKMRPACLLFLCLFTFACLLLQCALPSPALGAERLRVAVIEFDVKGDLEVKDAGAIMAEWMITALVNEGHFELKAREVLLKKVLQEQALGATGLIDKETAVEIGKIYGVQNIITGSVTKWGKVIKVDARLIDTQTGSVVRASDIEAVDLNDIPRHIPLLAQKISATSSPAAVLPSSQPAAAAERPPAGTLQSTSKQFDNKNFVLVSLQSVANFRLQHMPAAPASQYPEGEFILGGVPFYITKDANNAWLGSKHSGSNPRTLELKVYIAQPLQVYTLINSEWGKRGSEGYASLEFFGSNGAYFKKILIGDEDIRDWLKGKARFLLPPAYPNSINNTTTVNVFTGTVNGGGPGNEARLDRQQIKLPDEFSHQTLVRIKISDYGDDYAQRLIFSGLTVQTQ